MHLNKLHEQCYQNKYSDEHKTAIKKINDCGHVKSYDKNGKIVFFLTNGALKLSHIHH